MHIRTKSFGSNKLQHQRKGCMEFSSSLLAKFDAEGINGLRNLGKRGKLTWLKRAVIHAHCPLPKNFLGCEVSIV